MTTWADVNVGDVVEGRGGTSWVVEEIRNKDKGATRAVKMMQPATGKDFAKDMPSTMAVTILERGAPKIAGVDPVDLATATVTSRLAGEVILESKPGDVVPRCPRTFTHVGSLLGHLYIEHGVHDLPAASKAQAAHDEHHALVRSPDRAEPAYGYRGHTHDLGENQ